MSASAEIVLEALAKEVKELKSRVAALEGRGGGAQQGPAQSVASDADIDGQYGDPIIKYGLKEKYWPNQPDENIGYHLSECTPEYLDAMAKYLGACAYMARNPKDEKPVDEKKAGYKDKDAARARAWSARIRARGGQPFVSAHDQQQAESDEIPF